jgi:hypothetical protein
LIVEGGDFEAFEGGEHVDEKRPLVATHFLEILGAAVALYAPYAR